MRRYCLLCIPVLLLATADKAWQGKPIADWNEDDAQQVLSDSPWAMKVTPKITQTANSDSGRRGGRMAQAGGFGIGMNSMGSGMGRRAGMGSPPTASSTGSSNPAPPRDLTVRWESALPVQAAELKARNVNAPSMDEDHYAVAVYSIPNRMINLDAASLPDQLKGQAVIKREGKKDLKPSSVEVIPRDEGVLLVYYFSRSNEITRQDKQLTFSAQIGQLQVAVPFDIAAMTYQGKLAL